MTAHSNITRKYSTGESVMSERDIETRSRRHGDIADLTVRLQQSGSCRGKKVNIED